MLDYIHQNEWILKHVQNRFFQKKKSKTLLQQGFDFPFCPFFGFYAGAQKEITIKTKTKR
jgi:hypothetical protein